jgi:SAM-dependent methyltransferase
MPACVTHQQSLVSVAAAPHAAMLLPYPDNSKHAVHASRLAARVPAALLPALLRECHRVLRPGGVLELRLLDPSPERETLGPRLAAWLEARALVGLEEAFRCARPALLVPRWAREAGFVGVDGAAAPQVARRPRLPAAVGAAAEDRVGAVGALALRDLWRAVWGEFVVPAEGESEVRWWWEDEEVVKECVEKGTRWAVGKFVAMKAGGV